MEWTGSKKLLKTVWRKVRIRDVEKIDSSAVTSPCHTEFIFAVFIRQNRANNAWSPVEVGSQYMSTRQRGSSLRAAATVRMMNGSEDKSTV